MHLATHSEMWDYPISWIRYSDPPDDYQEKNDFSKFLDFFINETTKG